MNKLYPVFLDIENRHILVIGGGQVATRKIERLLEYKCFIHVVSVNFTQEILHFSEQNKIKIKKREFHSSDLKNMFIVIAATNNSTLNKSIHMLCRENSILVNAVDDPVNCDFYLPALVNHNNLSIAISTNGRCPGFAKMIRKKIEKTITSKYGELLEKLHSVRCHIKNTFDNEKKQDALQSYLYEDICDDLEKLTVEEIEKKVKSCI